MALEEELKRLVSKYASFNESTNNYDLNAQNTLDESFRTRIEGEVIKLISKELTSDTANHDQISKRYRNLSRYFHSDKLLLRPREIQWLETILSEGKNDGACFKCLSFCYERLGPQHVKRRTFQDINTVDELKVWLKEQKRQSKTRTQAELYKCLTVMVEQLVSHSKDTTTIKQAFLRSLMLQLPFYVSGYCAFLFAEELLAVYGVCLVALKLGQYLEGSPADNWRLAGQKMQEMSYATTIYTTALLARIIEISIWFTNQSYLTATSIASTLLRPMLTASPTPDAPADAEAWASETDIVAYVKNPRDALIFNTPELKLVASPIESYLEINRDQWLKPLRAGGQKRYCLKKLLTDLKAVDDESELSTEDKLAKVKYLIEALTSNAVVYQSGVNARKAINTALLTLDWYLSNESSDAVSSAEGASLKEGAASFQD